eukprot:Rhum_TRINITY_DN14380_c12_g1::Rhum_TRINITY_DN14380_c12_g1_i1::g.84493::m.84493
MARALLPRANGLLPLPACALALALHVVPAGDAHQRRLVGLQKVKQVLAEQAQDGVTGEEGDVVDDDLARLPQHHTQGTVRARLPRHLQRLRVALPLRRRDEVLRRRHSLSAAADQLHVHLLVRAVQVRLRVEAELVGHAVLQAHAPVPRVAHAQVLAEGLDRQRRGVRRERRVVVDHRRARGVVKGGPGARVREDGGRFVGVEPQALCGDALGLPNLHLLLEDVGCACGLGQVVGQADVVLDVAEVAAAQGLEVAVADHLCVEAALAAEVDLRLEEHGVQQRRQLARLLVAHLDGRLRLRVRERRQGGGRSRGQDTRPHGRGVLAFFSSFPSARGGGGNEVQIL